MLLGFSNCEEIKPFVKVVEVTENFNFIVSAILYASYNSLILIPILTNFQKYNLSNRNIKKISFLIAIILGFLIFIIYKKNSIFYPEILIKELPNMYIAEVTSSKMKILYGLVMISSIFTTAFSCGLSFLNMRKKENYTRNAFFICILALICSKIGFSNMVNICFPLFGFLGIFQIILIVLNNFKERK